MAENLNNNVSQLRSIFKNGKAVEKKKSFTHPIENHPLASLDGDIKSTYLDMLCVIAMYNSEADINDNGFIKRLSDDYGDGMSIEEHASRAGELDPDKMSDFVSATKEKEISYIFCTDAFVAIKASEAANEEQTAFIGEIAGAMDITEQETQFLDDISGVIIEHDFEKFRDCVIKYDDVEACVNALTCYIKPLVEEKFVSTEDNMHIYSVVRPKNTPLFSEPHNFENRESVILENQLIAAPITFRNIEKVTLINCLIDGKTAVTLSKSVKPDENEPEVVGTIRTRKLAAKRKAVGVRIPTDDKPSTKMNLTFEDVNEVEIINCSFCDSIDKPLYYNKVKSIKVIGCLFFGMKSKAMEIDGGEEFGEISITLQKCVFSGIGDNAVYVNSDTYANITVDNCEFSDVAGQGVLYFEYDSTLIASNSSFKKVKNTVVYSGNSGFNNVGINFEYKGCEFREVHGETDGIIANEGTSGIVTNCSFYYCLGTNGEKEDYILFADAKDDVGNKFVGSAAFN